MSRWLVLGGGLSGIAAARFLLCKGEKVLAADPQFADEERAKSFSELGSEIFSGPQAPELLSGIDSIVVSPGIAPSIPILIAARARKIPILTEIDLGLRDFGGKCLAITGTNGKSTTTAMAAHMLNALGVSATACGNIGLPVCDAVLDRSPEYLVIELSSYQLEYLGIVRFCGAAITSLSFDHLARHGTMENYLRTKWRVVDQCDGLTVVSADVHRGALNAGIETPPANRYVVVEESELPLLVIPAVNSLHDRQNALMAGHLVSYVTGQPIAKTFDSLATFESLPHRYRLVGRFLGQSVINDSKSTNVESVIVALKSIPKCCYLLLGGKPKGEPFFQIADYSDKIEKVFAFGEAAAQVERELGSRVPVEMSSTMAQAVVAAMAAAQVRPADILLSPGCASFDEFRNFEHRGEVFQSLVSQALD